MHKRSDVAKILSFLVVLSSFYLCFLLWQSQHIIVLAQQAQQSPQTQSSPPSSSLPTDLCSSSTGTEKYFCSGSQLMHTDSSGNTTTIADCASSGATCYDVNNTVTQQYCASCLYNPPVAAAGGGAGCPTAAELAANHDASTCHLLNPSVDIRDTNITQDQINTYTQDYEWEFVGAQLEDSEGGVGTADEFVKRVNYIISDFKKAGINPIFGLAYWKTESLFSTKGNVALGCAPDSSNPSIHSFYWQVDCAAGVIPNGFIGSLCMIANDPKSPSCAYSPRPGGSVPPTSFDDIAWLYGPFTDLRGGAGNCTYTYNTAIGVVEELGECKAAPDADVTISGFDPEHTQWIHALLAKYGNTRLPQLIEGAVIEASTNLTNWTQFETPTTAGVSGCTVTMYQYTDQQEFDVLLTHELGHVIDFCAAKADSHDTDHEQVFKDEGPITDYAKNNCVPGAPGQGSPSSQEDYAEMISYYLNPDSNVWSDCKSDPNAVEPNPFNNGGFPEHDNLAKEILGTYP